MKPITSSMHTTNNDYEPIFNYGHLRSQYVNSTIANGMLHVKKFIRSEHIKELRKNLLIDKNIFSSENDCNTSTQRGLSPVSRQCLWELHSGIMLRVLENISGLHNLLPDTHCRATYLLPDPGHTQKNNRHEPHTGLNAALTLIVDLDSGDTIFCTNETALASVKIKDHALQATYWQYNIDMMKSPL